MCARAETYFPADAARALPQEVAAELGPARGRHVLDDEQRLVLHVGVLVPAALEEVVLDLLAGVEGRERHLRDLPVHVARRRRLVARRRARQHAPVHGLPRSAGVRRTQDECFLCGGEVAPLANRRRSRMLPSSAQTSASVGGARDERLLRDGCRRLGEDDDPARRPSDVELELGMRRGGRGRRSAARGTRRDELQVLEEGRRRGAPRAEGLGGDRQRTCRPTRLRMVDRRLQESGLAASST